MNTIAGVNAAERFAEILDGLPERWSEADVLLTVPDGEAADRAAVTLASLAPGRTGTSFRLRFSAAGHSAPSADAVYRILRRLDVQGLDARLTVTAEAVAAAAGGARPALAAGFDAATAGLPADWSDLYLEVELTSPDDIDRAAVELGPVNPFLEGTRPPAFRFRAARRFGYGTAPQMTRRALARLDEAGIAGRLRVLRVISENEPVLTQGPVWRERGRSV